MDKALRLGFVLEYSLGHTTHAQNLKRVVDADAAIKPVYVELPFNDTPLPLGMARLPLVRSNWSVRASLGAKMGLRGAAGDLDAALFHTQVTSLFSRGFMARVPSVISLDATPLQYDALGAFYNHAPSNSGKLETFKKRMNERAFASAQHLVTWSEWAKGSLVSDYGVPAEKVTVIPPGIDTALWDFPPRKAKPKGEPVNFLFVGADFPRKGGETLLAALAQMPPDMPPITCDIVTKTPGVAEEAPNAVGVSVVVHENIAPNSPELLSLFARADVFVFPTQGDCLPLAVMEALAAGLPVITTNVGALSEAVRNGETGLIVPPGDAPALSNAMRTLTENADRRHTMGQAGRSEACRRFDADTNYRALLDVVRRAAESGAAPR